MSVKILSKCYFGKETHNKKGLKIRIHYNQFSLRNEILFFLVSTFSSIFSTYVRVYLDKQILIVIDEIKLYFKIYLSYKYIKNLKIVIKYTFLLVISVLHAFKHA